MNHKAYCDNTGRWKFGGTKLQSFLRVLAYAETIIQNTAPGWKSFQKDFWPSS